MIHTLNVRHDSRIELIVGGVKCVTCQSLIQKPHRKLPRVSKIQDNALKLGVLRLWNLE